MAETGLAAADKPRLLILIVAYNAERTISDVLARIPESLAEHYTLEVLAIDDASSDGTFETTHKATTERSWPFPILVLRNPVNQGYGGNQKIGYFYAMRRDFDFVALLHGDGQYAPECLPDLLLPLRQGRADAVLGSRMMVAGAARRDRMPMYKLVGNKVLTWFQNRVLGMALSEFHSGYRIYAVAALRRIPFHLNTNDFHFDTEIIIQLHRASSRIVELPIPTYYGDELCYVNGLRYARDVVVTTLQSRVQDFGLLYERKFDCRDPATETSYGSKLGFASSHREALDRIGAGARVVDLGAGEAPVAAALIAKGCKVTGIDRRRPDTEIAFDRFIEHDLGEALPAAVFDGADVVLVLDVVDHLGDPEAFVDDLHANESLSGATDILVNAGNVAFGPTRICLSFGMFNYGKQGILDRTHTRLFTFSTLRRLFEQAGFDVVEQNGIPAPFALALRRQWIAAALSAVNRAGIRLWPGFFAYEVFLRVRKRPTLTDLLGHSEEHSSEKIFAGSRAPDAARDEPAPDAARDEFGA